MPALLPDPPAPFVLLDDARPVAGACARLYRDPVEIVSADGRGEVEPALERIGQALGSGLHAAGYLAYEAGFAFEPALKRADHVARGSGPLLWFGLFPCCEDLPADRVPSLLPPPAEAGTAELLESREGHMRALARVLRYIRAGDIYQANVTMPVAVPISGNPLGAYAAIRPRARMGHGAIIRHDGRHILSFSPESFFEIAGRTIETRPMKGTARRLADPAADQAAAAALHADPKQRAENLMIVDLLRNDLARVCAPGSVSVPELFAVESYPTVHQMVSRVTGRLLDDHGVIEALRALFPCGSITGAPKIRAMEIIDEIEPAPRGIYTGSIGSIDPDGNARFNVAIRTISMENEAKHGIMGIGSGIVADSVPDDEWAECLDKARFLARGERV
ncbi:MAG TPA: aminodeoxychorismate synthase component I [Sphingobium sp.]|nr:aminodeoxychorismate synthase component I [Sphingobium sp.]